VRASLSAKLPEAGILRVIKTFASSASRPAFIYPRPNSINRGITGLVEDKVAAAGKKAPGYMHDAFICPRPGLAFARSTLMDCPSREPKTNFKSLSRK